MKKPTVLHILPTFDTGGLGSLALTMIDAWPNDVHHLAVAPKYIQTKPALFFDFVRRCGEGNVRQVDRHAWMTPPVWVDLLWQGIAKVQQGRVPENVIVYNFIDSVWSAQAVHKAGFKGKIAAHVGTVLPDTPDTRGTAQSPFAWDTRFVPASAAIDQALRAINTQPERIHDVVWNGVMLDKYVRTETRKFDVTKPVFGFCGRMAKPAVKDWATLFSAFRLANIPGAVLRIAGDGPLKPELVKMAQGLNVEFKGELSPDQMVGFLHGLDVFVMAALPFEGFSMALVEAVAAGCLVVGTDVPSVREVFEAVGVPGWVSPTVEHLAQNMEAMTSSSTRIANRLSMDEIRLKLDAKRMAREYAAIR